MICCAGGADGVVASADAVDRLRHDDDGRDAMITFVLMDKMTSRLTRVGTTSVD